MKNATRCLLAARERWSLDFWVLLPVIVGAALRFTRLGDYDNPYYTATVASMLQGARNFIYASFDPLGVVMVDKPPVSFWVESVPASLLGVSAWTVSVTQVIAGIVSIVVLYRLVSGTFGRVAGVIAGMVLAVLPASVIIDSRNEPDSLLALVLVLAAASFIRAAKSGSFAWLLVSAILMAVGFNTKLFVAFIPLPVFVAYYIFASRSPGLRMAWHGVIAGAVLVAVSLSWLLLVALTPAQNRPYIGSTRDNSIWTLVIEYNGIDRFTSFIGGRRAASRLYNLQSGMPPPAMDMYGQRLPPPATPYQAPLQPQNQAPSFAGQDSVRQVTAPVVAAQQKNGIPALFTNPLAGQLGWLLPLGLISIFTIGLSLLTEGIYRKPFHYLHEIKESPQKAQGMLWVGWFVISAVVFGMASATVTHPYYLVGVAIPLAAVSGIGLSIMVTRYKNGGPGAMVLPAVLAATVICQCVMAWNSSPDWTQSMVLVFAFFTITVLAIGALRNFNYTPLSRISMVTGIGLMLVIPLVFSINAGGQIARPNPAAPGPVQQQNPERIALSRIVSYLDRQQIGNEGAALATVSAREAAPFIVAGIPAIAIGGFSGNDPIFTVSTLRQMAEQEEVLYFLAPPAQQQATPVAQQGILMWIRSTWRDVSSEAGLPSATLYRYKPS